jgi:2-polyprenyl-3-methyl-5-hydroxy-6-metoxy-1,4-benzoquinol methylase
MSNPWDKLSKLFDTTKDESDIPSRAADNILIAWPVILKFINQYTPDGKNLRVLDYGCGSGSFVNKLSQIGYKVTGVDSSKEMIKIAKSAYGDKNNFLCGDTSILSTLPPFSIITSVMTFQFIENIEESLTDLSNASIHNGLFTFAVHNPKLIKEYLHAEILFEDFDSKINPKKGILNLGGNRIPIFIRSADEYNQILQKMGFEPLIEEYPPFTKEFLEKYPSSDPTDTPEFLILGYRKVR